MTAPEADFVSGTDEPERYNEIARQRAGAKMTEITQSDILEIKGAAENGLHVATIPEIIALCDKALSPASTAVKQGEPVAWQWSDFSGKWYTVDTARIAIAEAEQIARACAKDHEGRVRAVYASPSLSGISEEMVLPGHPIAELLAALETNPTRAYGDPPVIVLGNEFAKSAAKALRAALEAALGDKP